MDIYFPDEKLNIEFDWFHHYWSKLTRDKKRDDYLRSKWITVIRYDKSFDLNGLKRECEEVFNGIE